MKKIDRLVNHLDRLFDELEFCEDDMKRQAIMADIVQSESELHDQFHWSSMMPWTKAAIMYRAWRSGVQYMELVHEHRLATMADYIP